MVTHVLTEDLDSRQDLWCYTEWTTCTSICKTPALGETRYDVLAVYEGKSFE